MAESIKVEAFVLAGGKSSRMGQDKGLIPLNGKPMISYVLETLKRLDLPTKIIANNAMYEQFGVTVCKDVVPEKGPMGGLLTAFNNTQADVILLIGCDMPLLVPEAISCLLSELHKEYIVAIEMAEKINPLFALYPTILKEQIRASITKNHLKMTDFILKQQHIFISTNHQEIALCFKNINTPQDLEEAGRLL